MPRVRKLKYDNVLVQQPYYNGTKLKKWIHNGVVIWENGFDGKDCIIYPTSCYDVCDILHITKVDNEDVVYHNGDFSSLGGNFCYNAMTFSAYPDVIFITDEDVYYNTSGYYAGRLYICSIHTGELLYSFDDRWGYLILPNHKILENHMDSVWLVHTFNSSFTSIENTVDLSTFINDTPSQTPSNYRNQHITCHFPFMSRYIIRYRRAYDLVNITSSQVIQDMWGAVAANTIYVDGRYLYITGRRNTDYGNSDFCHSIYIRDAMDNTLATINKTDYGDMNYITYRNFWVFKRDNELRYAIMIAYEGGTGYRMIEYDSSFNKLQDLSLSNPYISSTISYVDHSLNRSGTRTVQPTTLAQRSCGRINKNGEAIDNINHNGCPYTRNNQGTDIIVCSDINGIDPFGRNANKCTMHHYSDRQLTD